MALWKGTPLLPTHGPSQRIEEQTKVDELYGRLDQVRATLRKRLRRVRAEGPSGSPQNRSERDSFATLYEDRLAGLDLVEERLVFGRLDLHDPQPRYIGRIGLTDAHHASILTDWRAPAAQAFYRATAVAPDGVVRRRHLLLRRRHVEGIEDEILDLEAVAADGERHDLAATTTTGDGALMSALAAKRTGRMGDIVATIQAEQDRIIRAPLAGALVVEGGPGTGKTAVALHRVAYLLYAHRSVLERSGVLVLGPSRVFLTYIDQVLPALGETGVVSALVSDLYGEVNVAAVEPTATAVLKADPRMARVIARAVTNRVRVPAEERTIRIDGRDLVLRPTDFAAAVARARATHKPYNAARVTFVREMLATLARQYLAHAADDPSETDVVDTMEDLRHDRQVRVALNLAWMPMTPEHLVGELYAKPVLLAAAAPRMSATSRELLYRADPYAWTESDIPLLDEAAVLLGTDDQAERAEQARRAAAHARELEYARQVLASAGNEMVSAEELAGRFAERGPTLTTAERATSDRTWEFAHVVVDEAQELTGMQWRMVARRVPTGSVTVVGDLAQRSHPAGARTWSEALSPVFGSKWRQESLTINYRNPAAVADLAYAYADQAGLTVTATTNARDVPDAVRYVHGSDEAVVTATVQLAADIGVSQAAGRVAVVAAAERVPALLAALHDEAGDTVGATDKPIVVTTPTATKGLEFDGVVLVEPAEIPVPADLFVAMTRPTSALIIVHSDPLPAGLEPQ